MAQVKVSWSGFPSSLATWEDEEALRSRFPRALAWGQAKTQGGRNVTGTPATTAQDLGPAQAGRPKRNVKPNAQVHGPDWVS